MTFVRLHPCPELATLPDTRNRTKMSILKRCCFLFIKTSIFLRLLAPARWRPRDRPRVVSSSPRPRTSGVLPRPGAVTWPLPAGRAWHPDVRHDIGWCLHFCFVRSSWRPDLIPPWSACCFGHPHPSRRPTRMSTGTSSLDWRLPGAANGEPWARPLWSGGGVVLLLSAPPACGSGHFRSYVGVAVGFIGLRGGPR